MAPLPESVRIKIERADKHIDEAQVTIDAFLNRRPRPYSVIAGKDAEGRPTYVLAHIEPIDPRVSAAAGDAIQNIRTSLDYLACLLWGRTNTGDCRIYFPIGENPSHYETKALGKADGIGQDAVDAISLIEPYKGGKGDALWRLHRLSIIDKHRLPLAVAGGNFGMHIPSLYPELFPASMRANPWIVSVSEFRVPLKDGDILFRDEPGREVKKDLHLPLFVALDEPGIFERKPVIPALKELRNFVSDVLTKLALLL